MSSSTRQFAAVGLLSAIEECMRLIEATTDVPHTEVQRLRIRAAVKSLANTAQQSGRRRAEALLRLLEESYREASDQIHGAAPSPLESRRSWCARLARATDQEIREIAEAAGLVLAKERDV